jgi:GNAT superfamily N-acetyltransferase
MMGFSVRRATTADAALLAEHRAGMFRDMGTIDPSAEPVLRREAAAYFTQALASDEYIAWVAVAGPGGKAVIGGAGIQLRSMPPRPDQTRRRILLGREAIVLNVYVDPEWRRRGVARRLMQELLEWTRANRVARVVLHASREGRPLYESLGFVATNEMRYTGALDPEVSA